MIGNSGGLLLSTSKLEGFGYAVGEAMACEGPVLSTNSDGVQAFIIPEVTGKFYTIGNIEHAVSQALGLLDDTTLRQELIQHGRRHVTNHLSPDVYAASFIETMHKLGIY